MPRGRIILKTVFLGKQQFECPKCDFKTESKIVARMHSKASHGVAKEKVNFFPSNGVVCDHCKEIFRSESEFNEHVKKTSHISMSSNM